MQKLIYLLGSGEVNRGQSIFKSTKLYGVLTQSAMEKAGLLSMLLRGHVTQKGEQARFIDVPVDCENDLGFSLLCLKG